MFEIWKEERPLLITLLALFYAAAVVLAIALSAVLLSGTTISILPPGMTGPSLLVESAVFAFFSYGLLRGWKAAWVLTILMNAVWLVMDSGNFIQGNLISPLPIVIAAATILILFLGSSRRYFDILAGKNVQ